MTNKFGKPLNYPGAHFNSGEEQAFKMMVIHARSAYSKYLYIFEVENEEKEPGFPDSLEISVAIGTPPIDFSGVGCIQPTYSLLVEYKVSDENGVIKFKPLQPLFYKRYREIPIVIRAWCVPEQRGYEYKAQDIILALTIRAEDGNNPLTVNIREGGLK